MIRGAMTDQKKALGKGLGSLIPMGETQKEKKSLFECPIEDVIPNPNQPRKLFPKEELEELASSIEQKGILQPLLVRPLGGGKYELIAGERRYRAAKQVGFEKVPVIIKAADETAVLELALIENIQRQDLNPIEEALAYKELLTRHQYTQEELARQVGKDRSSIANSLRLLKLPDKIRDHLINNKISMGHARALLGVENKELQIQIAEDIVEHQLSVREVEVLSKKVKEQEPSNVTPLKTQVAKAEARDFSSWQNQLEGHLRKKVQIKAKGKKGQLVINFTDDEEMEKFFEKLLSL